MTALQTCTSYIPGEEIDDGFSAVITPGASLDRQAHRWLCTFITGLSAVFQAIYIALGLWYVSLFLLIATGGLVGMLLMFQKGLQRHECVTVKDGHVMVLRYRRGVLVSKTAVPLKSIAIDCDRDPDYGLRRIRLRQHGRAVEIARDLSPPERAEFLEAFKRAIAREGVRPKVHIALCASGA